MGVFGFFSNLIGQGIAQLVNLMPNPVRNAVKDVTGLVTKAYNSVKHWSKDLPFVNFVWDVAKVVDITGTLDNLQTALDVSESVYRHMASPTENAEINSIYEGTFKNEVLRPRQGLFPIREPLRPLVPVPISTIEQPISQIGMGDSTSYPLPGGGYYNPPPSQRIGPSAVM